MRVLVLGGTIDGREVTRALTEAGHDVVTSLAGRTTAARRRAADTVIGGFGGPEGLARWLGAERIDAVVDATHPFASQMSHHAAAASSATGVPLLRLNRPGWASHPRAGTWTWADDHAAAAAAAADLAGPGGRVLLTVGRQPLGHYRGLAHVLARVAEMPRDARGDPPPQPPGWTIVEDRGPYELAAERGLLTREGIAVMVTKDSGAAATAAKLDAAAERGVPVVVVRRPPGPGGVPRVPTVAGVVAWIEALGSSPVDTEWGTTPGLPDEAFEHDGLITKRHQRAGALAFLRPLPQQLLWDVGTGSGAIAVEWARAAEGARAIGVERNPERAARARRNIERLAPGRVDVIEGDALAAIAGLPAPDAVFLGGGVSAPVLEACWHVLRPDGRIVAHGVTIETEGVLAAMFRAHGGQLARLGVEIAEPIGRFHGWTPLRAVTQWSCVRHIPLDESARPA